MSALIISYRLDFAIKHEWWAVFFKTCCSIQHRSNKSSSVSDPVISTVKDDAELWLYQIRLVCYLIWYNYMLTHPPSFQERGLNAWRCVPMVTRNMIISMISDDFIDYNIVYNIVIYCFIECKLTIILIGFETFCDNFVTFF